jgi:hypothetical protein
MTHYDPNRFQSWNDDEQEYSRDFSEMNEIDTTAVEALVVHLGSERLLPGSYE